MRKFLLGIGLILGACQANAPDIIFHPDENPKALSDWGVLDVKNDEMTLARKSFVYKLQSQLFSDYALKLRTIHIPEGLTAELNEDGDAIDFPVGTIISKTFYYPKGGQPNHVSKNGHAPTIMDNRLDVSGYNLIETRLLVRRDSGWDALPYIWNEDQTTARLARTGDLKHLTLVDGNQKTDFAYLVPNVNQCAGCHATNNTTRRVVPIGPKLRHLMTAKNFDLSPAPASYFQNVNWTDETHTLDARARAYLDINCSHCHNEVGPADTSGLHLEPGTPMGPHLGRCKTPIAAGTGTGNRKYGIVPGEPNESIFVYRMASTNPAEMMPELGRALAHDEGVKLISDWIESLGGNCEAG